MIVPSLMAVMPEYARKFHPEGIVRSVQAFVLGLYVENWFV